MSRPDGVAGDRLRSFAERIERINEDLKAMNDEKKDVFAGEGKWAQRQRRAYAYAAVAAAIHVSKVIPIGPIDLDGYDYRSAKLIEFRAMLDLDQDRRVPGAAASALNC